jgi:hypothetical protein
LLTSLVLLQGKLGSCIYLLYPCNQFTSGCQETSKVYKYLQWTNNEITAWSKNIIISFAIITYTTKPYWIHEIKYIIQTSRSKWQPLWYNISVPLDLKVTKDTRLILNIIYVWKLNQTGLLSNYNIKYICTIYTRIDTCLMSISRFSLRDKVTLRLLKLYFYIADVVEWSK